MPQVLALRGSQRGGGHDTGTTTVVLPAPEGPITATLLARLQRRGLTAAAASMRPLGAGEGGRRGWLKAQFAYDGAVRTDLFRFGARRRAAPKPAQLSDAGRSIRRASTSLGGLRPDTVRPVGALC